MQSGIIDEIPPARGVRSLGRQMTRVRGVSAGTAGRKRENVKTTFASVERLPSRRRCETSGRVRASDDNSQPVHLFEDRHVAVLRRVEQIKQVGDNEGGGNVVDQGN